MLREVLWRAAILSSAQVRKLSGTKFRQMLRAGEDIPGWFAFPEVVAVLRAHVVATQAAAAAASASAGFVAAAPASLEVTERSAGRGADGGAPSSPPQDGRRTAVFAS